MFQVPWGTSGRQFVSELARLFQAHAEATALESVAITAAMVMPHLLLQRPNMKSKPRDQASCLTRRMASWLEGDIQGLLREARTIQLHLGNQVQSCHSNMKTDSSRKFPNYMKKVDVRAAGRLLSDEADCGVLSLDECIDDGSHQPVREILKKKHPDPAPLVPDAVLDPSLQAPPVHAILFDQLDGVVIRNMALKGKGAAGPSGLNAADWRRLCTKFQGPSRDLCNLLALLARRISTEFVDPIGFTGLVSCHLIPLDKKPGVRPNGICETVRRIIGKAILSIAKSDILNAAGPLQLCAGQLSGVESATHAMQTLFDDPNTDAILLVDASNAFNTLNRQVALANISVNCPAILPVLANTYRQPSFLFFGGEVLISKEGTTQGDPLAMPMYALATVPLLTKVSTKETTQVWYADDAAAGGKLNFLKQRWNKLNTFGSSFGYLHNAKKSWLIVKGGNIDAATAHFENTNINITAEGRKYLRAALGTKDFCDTFLKNKVENWTKEIEHLSVIAKTQPHAAYSAFTHGVSSKWTYMARTNNNLAQFLQPLTKAIDSDLIPALTGQSAPGETMRKVFALPVRRGGLGIIDPLSLHRESAYSLKLQSLLPSSFFSNKIKSLRRFHNNKAY